MSGEVLQDALINEDFDLNSIFEDGGSDPVGTNEVFECSSPHWAVSREELRKVLQVIRSFPSKATVFMALYRDPMNTDSICIHANNRDALVDVRLSLLNNDAAPIDKVYFLDTDKLLAFVNSYNQFVLSFDEDNNIYYESSYAKYKLDTVKASLKDMRISYDLPTEWFPSPLDKSNLAVLRALYGFAIRLADSKVLVNSSGSEAFFTLYKYNDKTSIGITESVIIRRLDLPIIHGISEDFSMDVSSFAFTKERLFFKFALGVVSFLRVPYDESDFMYPSTFLTGTLLDQFDVDVSLIRRALKLATLFNVEGVEFRSDGTCDVYMVVSDKVKFKVGTVVSPKGLMNSFFISLDTFSKLFSTITTASVSILVSEHGVDLRCGTEVYSLARVSVSQLKQGKIPQAISQVQAPRKETTLVADFQDTEVL